MNPYGYASDFPYFNLQLKRENTKWRRYVVDFRAAFPTRYEENHTVRGEYFQSKGTDKSPLLILLHGVGDHSVAPCRLLARNLAGQGIACFILYLVVHSSRMPEVVWKRMLRSSDDEWFEWYQTSVIEVRQVMDWASHRAEIDEEHIAVLGISFGGFISAIAMGVDERIRAGVFIVSGGNSGKIGQRARAGIIRRGYRNSEAEFRDAQNVYFNYLDDIEKGGFEEVTPPMRSFLIDPMTFAYRLRRLPVLMINAKWDAYIPREAAEDFWRASGQPDIAWFPATHTGIWLWYPAIRKRIGEFLWSAFEK